MLAKLRGERVPARYKTTIFKIERSNIIRVPAVMNRTLKVLVFRRTKSSFRNKEGEKVYYFE